MGLEENGNRVTFFVCLLFCFKRRRAEFMLQ